MSLPSSPVARLSESPVVTNDLMDTQPGHWTLDKHLTENMSLICRPWMCECMVYKYTRRCITSRLTYWEPRRHAALKVLMINERMCVGVLLIKLQYVHITYYFLLSLKSQSAILELGSLANKYCRRVFKQDLLLFSIGTHNRCKKGNPTHKIIFFSSTRDLITF